ncbi:MAG: DnaJ domain-containing protein [Pseudomonadota bacterium]
MIFALLGAAVLAGLLVLGQVVVRADPAHLAKWLRYLGAGAAGLLGLLLLLRGQVGLAVPALVGAYGIVRGGLRGTPLGGRSGGRRRSPGQSSEVETDMIRMRLDHDTGRMDGDVLMGAFAGKRLSELSISELVDLREECALTEPRAAKLVAAYIERMRAGERGREEDREARGNQSRSRGAMDVEEAREVLGVPPGASDEDIKAAHKRLMRLAHPDQGGTDYLASKINQAKDALLGEGEG